MKDEYYYKELLNRQTGSNFCCYKCNSTNYYSGLDFVKVCKNCKTKTFVTRNTIFHNIRFGLVKAFEIAFDYHNSNYNLSSIGVSKKYEITQKTAWHFLDKIKKNKDFIKKLSDENDYQSNHNKIKLENYLNG